jgi:hypothetical protein
MRLAYFIIALTFCNLSIAQSYQIGKIVTSRNGQQSEMAGVPGDLFAATITLSNTTSGTAHVFFDRYQKSIPPYWALCYCYFQCHSPADDTVTVVIEPYGTSTITLQFKTDSVNPGIATAGFRLKEVGTPAKADTIALTASTKAHIDVSLSEPDAPLRRLLFPNPASDRLKISVKEPGDVFIITTDGRIISQTSIAEPNPYIDLRTLQSGYYLVRFNGKSRSYTGAFIKD